ncbi:MAG: TonB-dependent receptor plug domain-containing protein, partial [Erythrobacter sp.]|nr:TonB-dependent receptor plug domain-containing protein [Erythrobacter sp.]
MKFRACLLAAVASPAFFAAPALAQDDPATDEGDNTIFVTSQRYEQSVQEVPIPVTVVSADQLEAQGVQEINDLGRTVSSLKLAENPGGSGGGGYIRGVGTFSRSRAAEPSVGIVVDGVVQGLTNIRNLSDIQRVEVLRGP